MASSIILHQDKIYQEPEGVLLSCLVQPRQEALLTIALRMQLPPHAGALHVAGGVAAIEAVTEGVADTEGVNCRGIAVALSFILMFSSARLRSVEIETLTCSAICRVVIFVM